MDPGSSMHGFMYGQRCCSRIKTFYSLNSTLIPCKYNSLKETGENCETYNKEL